MSDISVIITSYNQCDILPEAINSVIGQTLPPSEIIVCDDASKDASRNLIQHYEKKFKGLVRGIFQNRNLGVAGNRNTGLKAAAGHWVTWLDGDDIFLPRKLELESECLSKSPEVKWIYSQVIECNALLGSRRLRYRRPYVGQIFDKVIAELGRAPRNPLVESSALEQIGFFDEILPLYEDFDLCLRLSKFYPCLYQPEPAIKYQIHAAGLSATNAEHHWQSLEILHQNLSRYLQGMPAHRKKLLNNRFLSSERVFFFHLKGNCCSTRKSRLIRQAAWAIFHNPALISRMELYSTLVSIMLPLALKARLKHFRNSIRG